jgi:hypothetical protein
MTIAMVESPNKTGIGTEFPFHRDSSETLVVTSQKAVALAKEHQSLPRSPTERELDPKRVQELVNRIKAGLFLPCNWATVNFDGVKYRMNGQHSSRAILDAADVLPSDVVIHLDLYTTDTSSGMGVLFRQFDARFSGRTKKDVAGAYQSLVKEFQEIDRRYAKLGIEGISWYNRQQGLPVPSGDDLYDQFLVPEYRAFLLWLDEILSAKTPEMLRAPIVASMYGTFSLSAPGAKHFWTHVAKDDLSADDDPRFALSKELQRILEEKKSKVKPDEFYAKCIKAWNAFCSGEKIRNLNVSTKKGLPEIAAYQERPEQSRVK